MFARVVGVELIGDDLRVVGLRAHEHMEVVTDLVFIVMVSENPRISLEGDHEFYFSGGR